MMTYSYAIHNTFIQAVFKVQAGPDTLIIHIHEQASSPDFAQEGSVPLPLAQKAVQRESIFIRGLKLNHTFIIS